MTASNFKVVQTICVWPDSNLGCDAELRFVIILRNLENQMPNNT